ncbi:MAG TPA: thermonuclease family protein [Acidimicrobiales bacterium]|jgi:micrococcal nuclease|nr:thermonuclease family protein [Acidimicrobiales bacterium]
MPPPVRALFVLVAAIVAASATARLLAHHDAGPDDPPGSATVVRVVDGDTVVVDLAGHDENVRLIGIDTPESVAVDRPDECYGVEASANLSALVPPGTKVRVERDLEARDQYDRLLGYIYRVHDDLFVNLAQVTGGFAETLAYPPNTTHRPELEQAEREARTRGVGLWTACGTADIPIERAP